MHRVVVLAVWIALAACGGKKGASSSKEVRIAAAADLARAFEEIGPAFEKATGIKAVVTPGSTGLLAKQIAERAPFDLFAAANISYVDQVVAAGACDGATKALYARGRLVVWARGAGGAPATFADLADPKYAKIGIANPDHAPYGKAARQALQKAGIWDQVKDRLVLGENVQVPMQWAKAGEVDAAIVALSLAVVADGGSSIPVDPALHDPLDQAMVVCGTGPGTVAAKRFQEYLGSDEGREIMTRYGFLLPGETAPPPKGGTGGDRAGSGSAATVVHLDEAAVRQLVDGWLAAQNDDDFAAYQAAYAERFSGIKRVGPRTSKFDRTGWLADRGKMFTAKAAMKVTAEDVMVTPVGQMAVVRMRQTFAQAKFKDTGDKQLVVVSTKDGLRIAREEMLVSSLVDRKSEVPPGMVVIHDAAGAWMILGDAYDAETDGEPRHGGGGEGFDYSTHTKLADKHALVGDDVTLYPSGATCKIADVSVMSMLTPHFGTTYEWRGDEDGDGQVDGKPLSEAEIDAEVAGGGAQYLAADVSGCAGGGDDVVGMLKPGTPWEEVTASDLAPVFAAFEKLDDWKTIQDEFADSGASGEWTEVIGAETAVSSFRAPDGRELVAISARAGDGCGEFEGALVAVFEVKGGKAVLHALAPEMPEAVVDLDADGEPEVISETAIFARDGDTYGETVTVDLGFRDCGC